MGKVIFLLGLAVAFVAAAPSTKIESRLAKTLVNSRANILVSMKEDTSSVLASFENAKFATHGDRTTAVAVSLMAFAEKSQKEATTLLNKEGVQHKVFWITNQIYIRDATADLVQKLASLETVSQVTEEFEVKLDPIIPSSPISILAEWGVEKIEAPAVWASGITGEGIIVGSIDTGVRATHKDLPNYVGNSYGWLDATIVNSQSARDGNGHGTHTIGTIVGQNGIGVAPGAKYMSCKGLTDQGSGTNAGLIECGQFMACPTLPNGQSPDCTKAPHIVSNSWGGGQANAFYNQVIQAWKTANIIPVFANGNSGPECGTANSPADSLIGVIAVGATEEAGNAIAYFSSKGPTLGGRMKPDISAPGVDVKSAWITNDSAYNTISGTSMATPHVAGVVALMRQKNPGMTYDQVYSKITSTATKNVANTGSCDGISEDVFPNYSYGHGLINARLAVA